MPPLAQRNLFHDKVRLAVTLTGIVFSVELIVVQLGLFLGFTTATSNLIDHSGADLWITADTARGSRASREGFARSRLRLTFSQHSRTRRAIRECGKIRRCSFW